MENFTRRFVYVIVVYLSGIGGVMCLLCYGSGSSTRRPWDWKMLDLVNFVREVIV